MAVNAEFATALGASPASSDTVESEGSADEAVLNNLPKSQKSPWKISILAVTRKRMFFYYLGSDKQRWKIRKKTKNDDQF